MIKRRMFAGLALAGALTVWAGASAFAHEGSGDPAEALLEQAAGFAATASESVATCAEAQITKFETTAKPETGSDAADGAVEKANDMVLGLAESAQEQIETTLDAFADTVDAAEEDGGTPPTAADLQTFKGAVDKIASDACTAIAAVQIRPETTPPTDTENDNERDSDSGDHHSSDSERTTDTEHD